MVDKLGSELARGDEVTLTGKIIAVSEDGKLAVRIDGEETQPGTLVQVKPANVTKQGDSDTLKAARRGFNSAFEGGQK